MQTLVSRESFLKAAIYSFFDRLALETADSGFQYLEKYIYQRVRESVLFCAGHWLLTDRTCYPPPSLFFTYTFRVSPLLCPPLPRKEGLPESPYSVPNVCSITDVSMRGNSAAPMFIWQEKSWNRERKNRREERSHSFTARGSRQKPKDTMACWEQCEQEWSYTVTQTVCPSYRMVTQTGEGGLTMAGAFVVLKQREGTPLSYTQYIAQSHGTTPYILLDAKFSFLVTA